MKNKKFYALFLAIIFMFNMSASIPLNVFAEVGSQTYTYDGYEVDYAVLNEWEGNQSIQVTIRNTGMESILNWALAYRAGGEVNGLWNAVSPKENIIKNAGYNYEIEPNSSVSFGYTLSAENFELPKEFEIVSKRANVSEGYEVQFDVFDDWGDGFQGAVTVTNTGSEPLEAWTLTFDTNFTIGDYWGGCIIDSSENSYTIASELWTNPIMPNSSSSFGFTATKQADTEAVATNFILTSVKIDENTITEEASITAEAAYDSENNAVSIMWLSTVPTSTFEVMTSLDGINFETAATVENVAFYEYAIDSGFGVLYVKVRQNSDGNVVESNIVTVTEEDIDYELDTDEDGLPDYYEDILGTDKNKADTDGDGLSDGYEVLYLGTDPLKADTDDNGINDGDEDFDNDGLTNAQECELGTDPNTADTDGDGLNDGAEVNTHGTDPLKYDTDCDGISDGDEITLGLNPNSAATDGTPDSERTFTQVVSSNSEVLSAVNDDSDTPFKVSLEMKSAGVAENNVYARESGYSNAIENSAIIGIVPEFVYTDGLTVEEVTVKFELDNSIIGNTLGTYAAGNDGFKGIKRLTVFMFFDDVNMLLPVETNYDEVNNVVYTTTDRVGTYCLMDMEMFFQNLGIEPSKSAEAEISEAVSLNSLDIDNIMSYNMYSEKAVNINNSNFEEKDNFDVAFVVGEVCYNEAQLEVICNEIYVIAELIYKYSEDVTISLYGLDGTGDTQSTWYGRVDNLDGLKERLTKIKVKEINNIDNMVVVSDCVDYVTLAHMNTDSDEQRNREEYCFMFFDPEYKIKDERVEGGERYAFTYLARTTRTDKYGIKLLEIINREGTDIDFSTVTGAFQTIEEQRKSYAKLMSYETDGVNIDNITFETVVSKSIEHIYGQKPTNVYKAIIATGYKPVILKQPLTEKDKENARKLYNNPDYVFTDIETVGCADTDDDGLFDFQEVMFFTKIRFYKDDIINFKNGEIVLPTVRQIAEAYSELAYIEEGMEKARIQYGDCWDYFYRNYPVLPIYSDPTKKDTDEDEIEDLIDRKPLVNYEHFSKCLLVSTDNMHSVDKHYFDKENNPKINRDKQLIFCCENCDEEFLSPEYQDKDILNESEYALVQMISQVINNIFDKEVKTDIDENHMESLYLIIDRIRSSKSANGVNFYDFSSDYENGRKYTSPLNYKYNNVNNKTHTITLDIRQTTHVELYESMQLKLFASYGLDYALGLAFSWKYTAVKVAVDIANKDISTAVSDIVDANVDELSNRLINAIANDDKVGTYLGIGNILLGYNYLQSANNINKQFDSNMYYNYIYSGVICITDSAQEQEVYYINLCFDNKDNINQACIDVKDFEIFCNNQDNYNEFTLNNGTTHDILYSHPDSNTKKYKLL